MELANIAATRAINTVIMRGHIYNRAALDRMLSEVREQVTVWNREAAARAQQ